MKAATSTQPLTAEEQAQMDAFNQAILKFKAESVEAFVNIDKKISISTTITNINGTKSVQILMDANGVYYPGETEGTWKGFYDESMIKSVFKSAQEDDITSFVDKTSLKFAGWRGVGKTRSAVFSGKFTPAGNESFIKSVFGENPVGDQDIASVRIYAKEKSKLWDKYEATISNFKSDMIVLPLKETCQFKYGSSVKVFMPSDVAWVDPEVGIVEMVTAMNSIYQ